MEETGMVLDGERVGFYKLNGRKKLVLNKKVADWYDGPREFNLFVVNFGSLFENRIEDLVPEKDRIRSNRDDLTVLSFLSDEVLRYIQRLIGVVNFSSRPLISESRKKEYAEVLSLIAGSIRSFRKNSANGYKEDLTIVPLKGGSYFLDFLEPKAKRYVNVLAIECKRVPMTKENNFYFAMQVDPSNKYLLNNKFKNLEMIKKAKKIRIVELCIVSGMTTVGFMLFLYLNRIRPEVIEINTIGMSQQGYQVIKAIARQLGFKVRFLTGGLFYRLGNFYLSRRDELLTLDEKLVIGDVRKFLD